MSFLIGAGILIIGILLGCIVCKIICGNKFLIDQLMKSLSKCKQQKKQLEIDIEELKNQNDYLKHQVIILQKKTYFLNEAVGNYEDAVVRLKKISNLVSNMIEIIKDYDYEFFEKFKEFLRKENKNIESEQEQTKKW